MGTLEEFLKAAATSGPKGAKAAQHQVAQKMQDWIANEINVRLQSRGLSFKASADEKRFAGGIRMVKVDVHIATPEFGLVLAMDPKHLQSEESIRKNWQNALNDLTAFANNLHMRFPMCVVGAVFGFEASQISDRTVATMYDILHKSSGRDEPDRNPAKLEVCGIVIYDAGAKQLDPNRPAPESPYRVNNALDTAVDLFATRLVGQE